MNSRERMLAAMTGKPCDRIPVSPIFFFMVPLMKLGYSSWQLGGLEEPAVPLHEARADAYRKYGLDAFLKQKLGVAHPFPVETREVSRTADRIVRETVYHTPGGDLSETSTIPRDDAAWSDEALFDNPADNIDAILALYDFDPRAHARDGGIVAAHDYLAGDGIVSASCPTAFDIWLCGRSLEAGLLDVYDIPDVVDRFVTQTRPYFFRFAEAAARTVADILYIPAAYTSLSCISPDLYRKYILPEVEEIVRIGHAAGKPVCLMINGRCGAVLADVRTTGVDAISPLERPPLGDTPIGDARKILGDDICLVGNIDPINTLYRGTREQIRQEFEECRNMACNGSRMVIGTSDQVPGETPDEHLYYLGELAAS